MRKIKPFILAAVVLAAASCKKSGNNTNYPYYFNATINGAAVKYEADDLNSQLGCGTSQPESSLVPTDYDIYEGTFIGDPQDLTKNAIYVHILKYFNHDPSLAEREAMVHTGAYGYGVSNVSSSTINGASIDYEDANGNFWTSEFGPQTGSTFNITELIDNSNGTSAKIFTATFSCKLYDGAGGSITVNNATIRGKVLTP